MIIDMSGKVVLVTGASQGLGEIIAIEFAKCNADVVVTCRARVCTSTWWANSGLTRLLSFPSQSCCALKCAVESPLSRT